MTKKLRKEAIKLAQINLKTGNESSIPSKKVEGTVYFTVDSTNKIGKIFFDNSSSSRVNIVPDIVDCGEWSVIDLGYKDPNCCFVAGSLVLCDVLGATKPIEQVASGDIVLSYNIFTECFYPVVVQKLLINPNTVHLAQIMLDNGESLTMNAYHPIYTQDGFHSLTNYNGYDTLVIGDKVCCFDGYHEIIDIIEEHLDTPITTYNLAIKDLDEKVDSDEYDTFVVGNCVVHNAACPT